MESVILVDEQNNQIGTAPKDTVHTDHTPLHRAFSLFLFNAQNQLLVTKRATTKKTFPGLWTNSVCGHVAPGESTIDAVRRRANEELHVSIMDLEEVSPYRYKFADKNGIVEHEICPIFSGITDQDPMINQDEVDEWKWVDWSTFLELIKTDAIGIYSPWCKEEAVILAQKRAEKI